MEICPFVYGRALRPNEVHDRRGDLRRLLVRLVSGQSTAIIGQRKIGKTSLLNYLSDREARQAIIGDKLDQSIFAYIDSQMLGSSFNQAAFWKQALSPLTAQFPTGAIYDVYKLAETNQFGAFTLEQLFTVLGKAGWQFVLLLDEFDALLTHPVLNSPEFYGGLRSLTSRCAGFVLVIASRRSLALLEQDTHKINPHGSPYFLNVFTEVQLGPLPKGYAQAIINQAGQTFGNKDREFIFRVSGRHPYLLQTAAAILWEINTQGRQDIDRYRDALDEFYSQTRAHCADTWNSLSNAEREIITVIALAQIPAILGFHTFSGKNLIENITDYSAEVRRLKDDGTIIETGEDSWQLAQQPLLWWLADEFKRINRDNSGFEEWFREQVMDNIFTKKDQEQISQAAKKVNGFIDKGAVTLIEAFAEEFGVEVAKATRVSRAEKFYTLGIDYFKNGEFDEAEHFLTKSLLLNQDHLEATLLLGRTYLGKQQFEKSIEIFERAYQYDPSTSQPFLLQALKAEADRSYGLQKIKLYERIYEICPEDHTVFELKDKRLVLLEELGNYMQGHANLEVELLNRQEDLVWQDEIVLKFQIKNKGNFPANHISVQLSSNEAYKIIGDSLFKTNFITPVHPIELGFQIQPIQRIFTLTLNISYTDTIDGNVQEQRYEQHIQLSQESNVQFERIDNPYRSGNLTQYLQKGDTSMFYGRRDTIQTLKNILIENNEGLAILYGQRRTGKSCLLKYIEKAKCFAPDVLIIFTNLQGLASEQDFYVDILNQAAQFTDTALNINTQVHSFDEFTTSLNRFQETLKTPFLIMLDEFEYATDERFKYTSLQDATDFIRRLRNLIQYSMRIKFALAGADGLRAMINDYHNPLFKAGRTFHIAFLSPQDARALIIEPLQGKVTYTEQAITSIHHATADHPYYIQLLCQTIVMMLNQKKINTVTITEVNQAIEYLEKTGDDNFDYVWDITSKETHLLLAILAQEMQATSWVALERIDEIITEHKLRLPEESVDAALKELLEKNLITESHAKLEYIIPMGLLRTWITRYKPLKKIRREVNT